MIPDSIVVTFINFLSSRETERSPPCSALLRSGVAMAKKSSVGKRPRGAKTGAANRGNRAGQGALRPGWDTSPGASKKRELNRF